MCGTLKNHDTLKSTVLLMQTVTIKVESFQKKIKTKVKIKKWKQCFKRCKS